MPPITFKGEGNILWCGEGTRIEGSRIHFAGSNALVYIGKSKHALDLSLDVWSNASFCIGRDYFINGTLHAIASERQAIIIGDDALFSFGIWMRTADPHLVYRCVDGIRVNQSRPICIGDHVWIGQSVLVLKGTSIGSGAILGGGSVCAGKVLPSNTSWAGNPAKKLASGVFFTKRSVHNYSIEQTEQSQRSNSKAFTYVAGNRTAESSMEAVAAQLAVTISADEKLQLVHALYAQADNNRFAIFDKAAPNTKKHLVRRAFGKAKRILGR